ncbi:MAG TPA: undecaprenyldiphospho-muramoylpentapeptide beta-N-acetylglucosaminyltransferase [Syntrophomonadaceae bacterium]|nr:undecaprenyldiphospho-muramoylpentapeptide beta-N-acetylglucosaminyltransferase [Syntrophomonadaceae bacterium]HNX28465.1 undecaprenyldiphospho-muramoylpentapeptide beta-N-acetylglucosaminyltransferase [Syntrophomonadaceae bacterium]HPR93101.1 undecaprenyldiphospho-muramoylpentapeptide beta-N-acetylglucosaminyltransferase [Syntrophomonadaceae bacterium]
MKVIITGGGTGGHIYPALAIASELKARKPEAEILYVGTDKGMESTIVPKAGFNFKTVDISGLDRRSMLKATKTIAKFPKSFYQAWDILREFSPDIVVGTGGYVSFPVVYIATVLGCKTIIHEQNAVPGLANRHLAKRVDHTLLTFAEAEKHLSAKSLKVTGLPVRKEIGKMDKDTARRNLQIKSNQFTLIAFGGSQGAASINKAVLSMLNRPDQAQMQIIWITGEANYQEIIAQIKDESGVPPENIHIYPYMYNIEIALAAADLAVCRAGAGTISELAILGLPAIFIPYPYAADNHQEKNARALVAKNAAELVIDEFLDGDTLFKRIERIRRDKTILQVMKENMLKEAKPDALEKIMQVILN